MSVEYIDIHTHKETEIGSTIISVQNHRVDVDVNLKHDGYSSIGIHPWDVKNAETFETRKTLFEKMISNNNVLMIGEIGLDKKVSNSIEHQKVVFKQQMEFAKFHHLPTIIHCVRSYQEIISVKKELNPSRIQIIHGYRGNKQTTESLLKQGFYLSFGAYILKGDPTVVESLRHTPLDKMFFETDDIADVGIKEVYQKAAEILSVSVEEFKKHIYATFSDKVLNPCC